MTDYNIFELGNLRLQGGATLRGAWIAYKTYGTLNAARDNVIVFPTFFGGQHYANEAIIGAGQALDPERYFIIVPNMMGNGLSSSPSNTPTVTFVLPMSIASSISELADWRYVRLLGADSGIGGVGR